MKANFLSFVFIYFSESGLFNGLWPIQIKKFLSASARVPGCAPAVSNGIFSHLALPSRMAEAGLSTKRNNSTQFLFFQIIVSAL
jgi:hypothetical protein